MASWTTPTTHIAGDTLAVSDWNAVANNETFLYQAPYASYYNSVATSIPTAAWTQVTLGGVDFSGYGISLVSNNLVVPIAGIYGFVGQMFCAATANNIQTGVYHNGSLFKTNDIVTTAANGAGIPAAGIMKCSTNDTLGLWGFQNSGGTVNTGTGSTLTYLAAWYIGSV